MDSVDLYLLTLPLCAGVLYSWKLSKEQNIEFSTELLSIGFSCKIQQVDTTPAYEKEEGIQGRQVLPCSNDAWTWAGRSLWATGRSLQRNWVWRCEQCMPRSRCVGLQPPKSVRYELCKHNELPLVWNLICIFVLIFMRREQMELVQLHVGNLSKEQLNQQQKVKYLRCKDAAKYCQKMQRLLSKCPPPSPPSHRIDHIVGERD